MKVIVVLLEWECCGGVWVGCGGEKWELRLGLGWGYVVKEGNFIVSLVVFYVWSGLMVEGFGVFSRMLFSVDCVVSLYCVEDVSVVMWGDEDSGKCVYLELVFEF